MSKTLSCLALIYSDQIVTCSKINIPNSRLECKKHILVMTKMTKIDTIFLTKRLKKCSTIYPFRRTTLETLHTTNNLKERFKKESDRLIGDEEWDGDRLSPTCSKTLERPLSRNPQNLYGPVKSFLVHLHLKTEKCIRLKLLVWMKQLCNRKVRDLAMAFRARKVFGAFEKQAPGPSLNKHWEFWFQVSYLFDKVFSLSLKNFKLYKTLETFLHKKIDTWANC